MKYLLDTHVMIWSISDPASLGKKARKAIEEGSNILFWSAISFWELTVKISLGKLKMGKNWVDQLEQEKKVNRIQDLAMDWRHCRHHETLPWHHRDPFDRLLICQALAEDLTIITKDRNIMKYSVGTIW